MKDTWTKPYFGLTHLGQLGDERRSSVQAYGPHAEMHKWYRGCAFSQIVVWFDTVEEAKRAGENWTKDPA